MAKSVALPFIVPNFATLQSTGAAEFAMIGVNSPKNYTEGYLWLTKEGNGATGRTAFG